MPEIIQNQDMSALLRQLLNNSYIPLSIQNSWWILTSDDIVLSFHSEKDIQWLMNRLDILEIQTIRGLQGHNYNIDIVRQINMVKMAFFAKLNRSKNGGERNAQISQITSEVHTQPAVSLQEGTGFIASMKRLVSGGN